MFYQNSNDLVKNASNQSGHIQNSSETRQIITAQVNNNRGLLNSEAAGAGVARAAVVSSSPDDNNKSASLDFGTKFLNQVQSLFSLKEGNTNQEDVVVNNVSKDVAKNGDIELAQLDKEKGIMDLIQKQDENTRNQWAEVTDTTGVSLFGYITQNGIFQIGDIARSSNGVSTSWLDTYRMKNNAGVIGCPKPDAFKKYKVAGKWSDYKMFDMIYDVGDTAKSNPLFMITANVRDHRSAYERDGIFACGNEGKNVYVKERPSAVFQMTETDESVEPGCYIFDDNVNDNELRHRGFSLQNDLTASSIAQCKRRAEDLGRTHFLLTPPNPGNLENTGRCWVYDRSRSKPNLAGVMKIDKTGNACHKLANREEGEDEIMAEYSTADLPRLYGKKMIIPVEPAKDASCDHRNPNQCITRDFKRDNDNCYLPKKKKPNPDENSWCQYWARIGECEKNPGYMLYRCQTSCQNSKGFVGEEDTTNGYTARGVAGYSDQELKQWVNLSSDPPEWKDAKKKYVERCKGTKGYTFLDDKYVQPTKPQVAGALYSLKKYGPTGVNLGPVGKIAYIDHNGERHNYPESALSYLKPGSYVEMAGYDTRSADSTYGIDDTFSTNKFPALGSMSKWEMNIEFTLTGGSGWRPLIGDMYNNVNTGRGWGVWVSPSNGIHWSWKNDKKDTVINVGSNIKYNLKIINNENIMTFILLDPMSGNEQTDSFYKPSGATMSTNGPVTIGGWMTNTNEKFVGTIHSINIPGMYSIINPTLGQEAPLSNPIPVAKIITTTNDQCRQLCDANEKCGGYVFTKGTTDSNGKCELKDREKMFPNGLRIADKTKQFFIKVPTINSTMKDEKCITANQVSGDGEMYKAINSAQYSFYPDGGAMTPDFKCDMKSHIPKGPGTVPVNLTVIYDAVDGAVASTTNSTNTYKQQTSMKEGFEDKASFEAGTYGQAIQGVGNTLKTIANSKYQRERLLALTEESNKTLISESYKFILWSILAILTVLALLKLKEMFGQEDADDSNDGAGGDGAGGGLLATILGWFGAGSIKTDDIPDRTEEVKAALSSAGNQLKESGEQLANSVTEGADNLVKSANEAAAGAVEGATNLVDKAKETASNAIDRIGTATGAAAAAAPPPSGATTGGKSTRKK
jgi:hypothetical protein